MRVVEKGLVGLIAVAACLAVAILFNVTQHTSLRLERLREATWGLHGLILLWAAVRSRGFTDARFWSRCREVVGSTAFLRAVLVGMLVVHVTVSVTVHLAFQTFSHDFTMIDDAVYHSHHGRLLYSSVLQRSFLSEHFSPILLLLVPLHALWATPWWLVLTPAVTLWSAGLVLLRLLRDAGVPRWQTHLAVLVFLNHPIVASMLLTSMHMECFLPLLLLAAHLFYLRRQMVPYAAMIVLLLAIKEDVGIYLLGLAVYQAWVLRRGTSAAVLAAVALTVTGLEVWRWMPALTPRGEVGYRFLSRWEEWGATPWDVLLGWVSQPHRVLWRMLQDPLPRYLACVAFLPFVRPRTLVLFLLPWMINMTASAPAQRALSLYYGIPLFAFLALACVEVLRRSEKVRRAAGVRACVVAVGVVLLNVAHFTLPRIPKDRWAFLHALHDMPAEASVQAASCFYPVLGYERDKELLEPRAPWTADYVIVRRTGSWPFTDAETQQLLARVPNEPYVVEYDSADFLLLRRASGFAQHVVRRTP